MPKTQLRIDASSTGELNVYIHPGLLEELATFCSCTHSMAKQPYDVYNVTKAANEAIALWMQREGMTVMASVMRSPQEHTDREARRDRWNNPANSPSRQINSPRRAN